MFYKRTIGTNPVEKPQGREEGSHFAKYSNSVQVWWFLNFGVCELPRGKDGYIVVALKLLQFGGRFLKKYTNFKTKLDTRSYIGPMGPEA